MKLLQSTLLLTLTTLATSLEYRIFTTRGGLPITPGKETGATLQVIDTESVIWTVDDRNIRAGIISAPPVDGHPAETVTCGTNPGDPCYTDHEPPSTFVVEVAADRHYNIRDTVTSLYWSAEDGEILVREFDQYDTRQAFYLQSAATA
ncbi:hypothetical protein BJX99DRAFT_228438 [Aspergillus californicus]